MARKTSKRIAAAALVFVMLFTGIYMLAPLPASAATSVKVGQATSDENGNIRGGKAGDQTGSEVSTGKWSYSSKSGAYNNWKYVIRAKDPSIAVKLADNMKKACQNNHIGYDQQSPDRFTCLDEAKAVGWAIDKIENDCETTCSQIISVCLNAAGISTARYWDASVVYSDLKETGKFNIFTSSEFTASSSMLEPGDILVSPGHHTAMVVESPNAPGSTVNSSSSSTNFKAGLDYQLTEYLYVRTGPGVIYPAKSVSQLTENGKLYATSSDGKAILNKGTVVTCLKTSGNWIQIPSGWICGKEGSQLYLVEYKETASQKALYELALTAKKSAVVTKTVTVGLKQLRMTVTNTAATTAASAAAAAKATTTSTTTSTAVAASSFKIQVGKDYVLQQTLNVRTGPGINYKNVKRSNLTADGKRHATKSAKARLKQGTVVTCLEVRGDWMRIPSGWVCCKPGNVKPAK